MVYSSEEEEISRDGSEDFYHPEHVEPDARKERLLIIMIKKRKQHLQVLKCLFVSGS